MSIHDASVGATDEWYTPKYVFDALGCVFDMDVATPKNQIYVSVPAKMGLTANSLQSSWVGFIWMNAPYGKRNGLVPWLEKFMKHGNGIALTPDRTSAPWWQTFSKQADAILFVDGKIKFVKPDGTTGNSPADGVTLMAKGLTAVSALYHAEAAGLGVVYTRGL